MHVFWIVGTQKQLSHAHEEHANATQKEPRQGLYSEPPVSVTATNHHSTELSGVIIHTSHIVCGAGTTCASKIIFDF